MDGEALERLLQRGLRVGQDELNAARRHWVILEEMAAQLFSPERDKIDREDNDA